MKKLFVPLVILLVFSLIAISCSTASSTTSTTHSLPTTAAVTTPPASTPLTTSTTPVVASPTASPTPSANQPQYGGTLTILTDGGITTFGAPWEASPPLTITKVPYVSLEALLKTDDQGNFQPSLAQSWDIAPDGSSVTFHLRQGVKFQDGTDFNADAVKYNFTAWPAGSSGAVALSDISSIDVIDPYTIKLNLKHFDISLLYSLANGDAGLIVSPTAAQKPATPDTQAVEHMVGTGPFKLTDWARDDHATFVKWDGYWQPGRPYLDGVKIINIADNVTKLLAFQSGVGQFVEPLNGNDVTTLQSKGYTIGHGTLGFVFLMVPDGADANSPFAKLQVREALEYAIDKVSMVKALFQGQDSPAYEQALSTDPFYAPGLQPRTYDPAKAKQLLAEAGYPNGFKTVLHTDIRGNKDLYVAVQGYLQKVGIDASLDVVSIGRSTEMATGGWQGIYMPGFPNPSNLLTLVSRFGNSSYFPSMYRPDGFQAKWDALVTQTDNSKRITQLQDLIKTMAEQDMTTPLWAGYPYYATDGTVHDIGWVSRTNQAYWDAAGTWLSK